MYLRLDNHGAIQEINRESWITIHWISPQGANYDDAHLPLDVHICLDNDKLYEIALPAYYRGDIYYAKTEDGLMLSDDLLQLAQEIGRLSTDEEMTAFFYKKGYVPVDRTLFKEIDRLCPNCTYRFSGAQFEKRDFAYPTKSRFDDMSDSEQYELFKQTLNRVIREKATDNSAILLSGGVDSRLLFAILKEYAHNITAITVSYKHAIADNCYDVMKAEKFAGLLGEKALVYYEDYNNLNISDLDAIIKKIPLSVHMAMHFRHMCLLAAEQNASSVFCGQNMDSLYNLGPTERVGLNFHGVAQWFKRFYLSEEYIGSLPDVADKKNVLNAEIAKLGEILFKKVSRIDLRLPNTADELVYNFNHSDDYTVFTGNFCKSREGGGGATEPSPRNALKTPFHVKTELYKAKICFLKGGDPQAVECGAFLNNVKMYLPYSDQRMIEFFSQLRLRSADIWKPKRFSYMYLKEFSGKYGKEIASFKKPTAQEMKRRFGEVKDLYGGFEDIYFRTAWGKAIKEGAGIEDTGYSAIQKYRYALGVYWFKRLMSILSDEFGVSVRSERL